MGLLGFLGNNSNYTAGGYNVDPNATQWGGPSQAQLGGYLGAEQMEEGGSYGQENQAEAQQNAYLQQLQGVVNGTAPSAAQATLQAGSGQAINNAMSVANATRGTPAQMAAASRNAINAAATGTQTAANQSALIKAQESQNALGQIGSTLGTMRGQDLNAYGQSAQNAQGYLGAAMTQGSDQLNANMQAQQINAQSALNAQQINANTASGNASNNNALITGVMGMVGGAAGAAAGSDIRIKRDITPAGSSDDDDLGLGPSPMAGKVHGSGASTAGNLPFAGGNGFIAQNQRKVFGDDPGMTSGAMSGVVTPAATSAAPAAASAAPVAMMSDDRAKTGIKPPIPGLSSGGSSGGGDFGAAANAGSIMMSDERGKKVRPGGTTDADSFLQTLSPYEFNYKDRADEPSATPGGRYLGIMAQNLERAPTGETLVRNTPRGKMIEGPAAIGAALAGLGRLNERVAALEASRAKGAK